MAVNTNRFRRKKTKITNCFRLIVGLVFLQALALLYVGFHHPLDESNGNGNGNTVIASPMESFLSSFIETSSWLDSSTGTGSTSTISTSNSHDDDADEEEGVGDGNGVVDDDVMQEEDRMAERVVNQEEEAADANENDGMMDEDAQSFHSSPLLQGEPLDDYYARKGQRKSQQRNAHPIPLVVGGSDGSGTRAFVDVLGRLGVPMLVDDPGTMDIHASKLFRGQGWPPFAVHALKAAGTSNYQISDLTSTARSEVSNELQLLKGMFERRATRLRSRAENKSLSLTSDVSYGFKAPITMLLLPMIQAYLYPDTGFKYLHIVRDGRDVALSSNQSPVTKFYNATYSGNNNNNNKAEQYQKTMAPVLGMQLWSDWNSDLLEWERQAVLLSGMAAKVNAAAPPFDYLVMRTEDLLNPESKFEALTLLADFVGSPKTAHELCCQSRRAVVDLGQSSTGNGGGRRFGKMFGNRGKNPNMNEDYANLKIKFMTDVAIKAGKNNPSELSPRERIAAMNQFREERMHLLLEENAGGSNAERLDRHSKLEEVGNLVAERVGRRQKMSVEERKERQEEFRKRLLDRKRGGRGGLADMMGRRRLDESSTIDNSTTISLAEMMEGRRLVGGANNDLLERHQRAGRLQKGESERLDARLQQRVDAYRARGEKKQLQTEIKHRDFQFDAREEALMMKKDRGRHSDMRDMFVRRRNQHGYAGDEALGKLLQTQLEKLKRDAPTKNVVNDRYGKWATLLHGAPDFSRAMHEEGARGLKMFGYEPPQRFMDRDTTSDAFVCDDTVVCEEDIVVDDHHDVKKD